MIYQLNYERFPDYATRFPGRDESLHVEHAVKVKCMVNKYFVCIQIIEEGMLPYYQQMMKKLEIVKNTKNKK